MPLPLIPLITAGAGLVQSIVGGIKARKTQKELENLKSPTYQKNQSILDYYNQALGRYGVNPTDSAMYKRQMGNINRNQASALYNSNQQGGGSAGTSSILRASNDATLNAEAAAEGEKNRRFGELGGATQIKAGEDRMAFDINEQQPYERKYNLLSMKAGAANQTANAGLSNIFGGLQTASQMQMINKMYGGDGAKTIPGSQPANRQGQSGADSTATKFGGANLDYLVRNRKILRPKQ